LRPNTAGLLHSSTSINAAAFIGAADSFFGDTAGKLLTNKEKVAIEEVSGGADDHMGARWCAASESCPASTPRHLWTMDGSRKDFLAVWDP
jgi:hypothetical protein